MSQRQATIGLIAGIVTPKYENHKRKHTPKDIQEDVKRDLGVDINYMKVWRSKERAIKMLRGGPTEGYIKMSSYLYMLDTVPIVVVDGAHLKGAYKGTFVSASTLDGADRHESIIKAVSRVYPSVPHYACVWHLWQNVCKYYKKSKNTLSDVFYAMAKAYRQEDFDEMMKKVEDMDHRVKDYLMLAGYEKWARVYAPVNREYYKPSTLISTYEIPIGPLPDEEDWNIPDSVLNEVVFPPKYKRPPGRPKKSRHKNMSEKISSSTNCCGQCGQEGQNRRTCSYFPMKR
ncbi:hypothetical protein MTR67_040534 [Solanum verrucosum]|uniref:Mutator-like transposase n=1 Tax=Solanum verrucosum TaxID=315347 RepID=A0AAF0ZS75_SOLVR|nr:hypothetical protein MTR67_040534 [Solanum verrucosum]